MRNSYLSEYFEYDKTSGITFTIRFQIKINILFAENGIFKTSVPSEQGNKLHHPAIPDFL